MTSHASSQGHYRLIAVYGILFAILIFHPHATMHVAYQYRPYAEIILDGLMAGLGVLAYYWVERLVDGKNEELRRSASRLADSFRYVDSVNRRLPLLQDIVTRPITEMQRTNSGRKHAFDSLLALAAVSVARAPWTLLRFVDHRKLKTVGEFFYACGSEHAPARKISNKALVSPNRSTAFLSKQFSAIRASDPEAMVQAFLILPSDEKNIDDERRTLLQVITDQAQLLHKYLFT